MSKASMPFINHTNVPETRFQSDIAEYPADLENWVLKPLFAYAGAGVKLNITRDDLDAVPEDKRSQFIIQRKVVFEAIVENPDGVKSTPEVRVMYLWTGDEPEAAILLGRISRGKMANLTGAQFTQEENWVGVAPVFGVDTAPQVKPPRPAPAP